MSPNVKAKQCDAVKPGKIMERDGRGAQGSVWLEWESNCKNVFERRVV